MHPGFSKYFPAGTTYRMIQEGTIFVAQIHEIYIDKGLFAATRWSISLGPRRPGPSSQINDALLMVEKIYFVR